MTCITTIWGGGVRYDSAEYIENIHQDGGPGSGKWGHGGRPGKVGGSAKGGGKQNRYGSKESGFSSEAKKRAEKKNSASGSGNGKGSKAGEKEHSKIDVKSISNIPRNESSDEWANVDEETRIAYLEEAREDYPNYGFTRNGTLANAIATEEGINTKPTSVSKRDFEQYVNESGAKRIYRGVQNFESEDGDIIVTGAEIRKEFSSSDDSTYGGGNFGSGYHFSYSKSQAEGFAKESEGGELIECAVKPGARFMKHAEWEGLPQSIKSQYDDDCGLYALTHGYDGIESSTEVINIVNRGALVYKDPEK